MAALLRSGKFLRMVAGLTRQQLNQPSLPGPSVASSDGSTGNNVLTPVAGSFEGQFQAWSLHHFQNVLPALGATTISRDEEEAPCGNASKSTGILELLAADRATKAKESKTHEKVDSDSHSTTVTPDPTQDTSCFEKDAQLQCNSNNDDKVSKLTTHGGDAQKVVTKDDKLEDEEVYNVEKLKVNSVEKIPAVAVEEDALPIETEDKAQPPIPAVVTQMVPVVPLVEVNQNLMQWYPLPVVCQMFRQQGRYWDLECLLEGSRGIRPEDRKVVYFWTLQAYADCGLFDRAVALSGQLHQEGLGTHFPEYHHLMSSFTAAQTTFLSTASYPSSQPADSLCSSGSFVFTPTDISLVSSPRASPVPPEAREKLSIRKGRVNRRSIKKPSESENSGTGRNVAAKCQALQRKLKKGVNDNNIADCLSAYQELEGFECKILNVAELSTFIELLVKADLVKEAMGVAEKMLKNDVYPVPKIFRFLLNRLASMGDVDSMLNVAGYLAPRVKKEVSFDNRLCNAYLAAGRGAEYLDILLEELKAAIESEDFSAATVQSLKDKFPRGGAMGLLESNPQLVENYTKLAHMFLEIGYIAPMNVLWTYHFIGGRHELANPLWEKYVKNCPQIMFQKVCQTARATSSPDLAQRLVNVLENASTITVGAKGIAYSCLLDVLTQRQDYSKGVKALRKGLESGVRIEDMNRTALKRLKEGFESTTNEKFPYEIPKKSNASKPPQQTETFGEIRSLDDDEPSASSESITTAVVAVN